MNFTKIQANNRLAFFKYLREGNSFSQDGNAASSQQGLQSNILIHDFAQLVSCTVSIIKCKPTDENFWLSNSDLFCIQGACYLFPEAKEMISFLKGTYWRSNCKND